MSLYKEIYSLIIKFKFSLKIIFSIALIVLLFTGINWKDSINNFSNINYIILIPLLLYLPSLLISSLKWKFILKRKDIRTTEIFKIYWISNFFSNFLPSTIGGDSYKVLKLKNIIGVRKTISSILLDRFTGLLASLIVSTFSVFLISNLSNLQNIVLPIISFSFIGIAVLLILSKSFLRKSKTYLILKEELNENKFKLPILIIISLLYLSLGAISLWAYYFMFGYTLNFVTIFIFYCLIQVVSLVPLTINSIGVYEGVSVYLFSIIGIPSEISFSIAILSRLILVIQTSIGGLIYLKSGFVKK